jgi:GNAT superfamily N-acetyltransferase
LAQLSDLDRIQAVVAAAYESHLTRIGFPPSQLLWDDTEAIEAGEIWIVGDPIVGAIILIETQDALLVGNVAVDPSVRGTGVGRHLMEFAEDRAINQGLRRVAVHHNDVTVEHRTFFDHLGYVQAHRRAEGGQMMMFMEKRVLAEV